MRLSLFSLISSLGARATVLVVLLLSTAANAQHVNVQRVNDGLTLWTSDAAWNTGNAPRGADSVYIPGWTGAAESRIPPAAEVVAGSISVGHREGSVGTIRVEKASLAIAREATVGEQGGVGTVRQTGGVVSVARQLSIAEREMSFGRYVLNAGSLTTGGISIARGRRTRGSLALIGSDAKVRTKTYEHGSGDAKLSMTADSRGLPRITATKHVQLAGQLEVDLSAFSKLRREIVLIDNQGTQPVRGGFSSVFLTGASRYVLRYRGGDGNDVTLRRVREPIVSYELFAARYSLNLNSGRAGQYRDKDDDGISNLAEYKIGSSPVHAETWDFRPTKDKQRQVIRYSERVDRPDVILVPQIKVNGQWVSTGVETRLISQSSAGQVIQAEYVGKQVPFRLHAELLPDPKKPLNVMLLVVDDLNTWVGCLGGHPQAHTPNIDKLAARGCLFTNAHSNAVICHVSRTSFLTGKHPSSTGVYANDRSMRRSPVLANAVTLPEHFSQHGYHSIASGKVFHNPNRDLWAPGSRRRSDFGDIPNQGARATVGGIGAFDWAAIDAPDFKFLDRRISTHMLGLLRERPEEKPFFAVAGFFRPHLPWYAPPRFFDRIPLSEVIEPPRLENDLDDVPAEVFDIYSFKDAPVIENEGKRAEAIRAYLATSTFTDEQVGRLVDRFGNTPAARNTIIALVSDHGMHNGQKRQWRKVTLWQESTRIPMIFVAPGIVNPGTRIAQPVSLIDLYPTLAELTNTQAPPGLEGESLVPVMKDPSLAKNRTVLTTRRYKQHALVDNRYRFIRYENGGEEFYDHQTDPYEWDNLAHDPAYDALRQSFRIRLPKVDYVIPGTTQP